MSSPAASHLPAVIRDPNCCCICCSALAGAASTTYTVEVNSQYTGFPQYTIERQPGGDASPWVCSKFRSDRQFFSSKQVVG